MEQRADEVQARLATVTSFGELVNAMQGVAAARAQHARHLIAGTDAYARAVSHAMGQALALLPPGAPTAPAPGRRPIWLLFCAEQAFNGGLSERVLAAAPEARGGRVLLLGSQGMRMAHAQKLSTEWSAPLIAHAEGAVAAADRLQAALVQAMTHEAASTVEMVYPQVLEGNHFEVRQHRLLPLDTDRLQRVEGPSPLVHLPPQRLLDALVDEYVSARLTQALLHSHAAENLSRLQAMAAAHDNVKHMTDELDSQARLLRQASITAEIVELAAGLRALRKSEAVAD